MVARIPAVRDDLRLSTAEMAVLLCGLAAGSIVGLMVAPNILGRIGSRRAMFYMLFGFAASLIAIGISADLLASSIVAFAALASFGFFFSAIDVLMNVEGASVERSMGKTVPPLMHAFFSVGTILGAAIGAASSALAVSVFWSFGLLSSLILVTSFIAVHSVPRLEPLPKSTMRLRRRDRGQVRPRVWKDARLLLIGVMVIGMSFAEGSANDWLPLATVDGHDFSNTTGALAYAVFVGAMTVGRATGGPLIDRLGRVPVLAVLALLGMAGIALFVFAPTPPLAFLGVALWGLGGSLGFPVGMSAAADHPTQGARRVSIVAIFEYSAFLVGPPILGLLGEAFGILNALILVIGMLFISLLTTPAASTRNANTNLVPSMDSSD